MTKSKIINIANKDNKYHMMLFNKLEEEIGPSAPNFLNDLDSKDPNIIKEIIFIVDNDEIEDMCFIKGFNDLKDCHYVIDTESFFNISKCKCGVYAFISPPLPVPPAAPMRSPALTLSPL